MAQDPLRSRALQTLDRHQDRREGGIPALSVLVGPEALGEAVWGEWAGGSGRDMLPVRTRGRAPAAAMAERWASRPRILDRLVEHLSHALHAPQTARGLLAGNPCQERSHLVDRMLAAASPGPVERLCRRLLVGSSAGDSARLDAEEANDLIEGLSRVEGRHAPAILVLGSAPGESAMGSLAEVVERCPGVPIGWAVSASGYTGTLEPLPASRAKTLCREGLVFLETPSVESIRQRLGLPEGPGSGWTEAACRRLAEAGASDGLLEQCRKAAAAAEASREGPEASEKARSAAEAFLFRLLEDLPETSGLFELNGKVAADWGPRRQAEVDLLCRSRMLAVEIDGYYHFCDPDGYRRDRKKDLLLQQKGFLVLRFLADDVVAGLETIVDTILASLRWREHREPKRGKHHV